MGGSEIVGEPLKREEIRGRQNVWAVLAPHWRALLEETQECSPFLSLEWIESWLSLPQDGLNTTGLLWRDEKGRVVGCALLSIQRCRVGPFTVRRSFLNASGGVEVASEHNDLLALERYRRAAMEDLVQWQRSEKSVDEFAIFGGKVRLSELAVTVWPPVAVEGYSSESPYVDLEAIRESGGDYLDALSSNTRGQIRRSMRLYRDSFGPPTLEFAAGEKESLQWLEDLIQLHEGYWRSQGLEGAFSDGRRGFHMSLIRKASDPDPGSLRVALCRSRFGDQLIGMLYLLVFRGRVYFYQSGFNYYDDDNRLKPGLVTHALAIQHFLDDRYAEYDLLGGEPDPVQYKSSLSTRKRTLQWIRLPDTTRKMRLIDAARRAGRRLLNREVPEFVLWPDSPRTISSPP